MLMEEEEEVVVVGMRVWPSLGSLSAPSPLAFCCSVGTRATSLEWDEPPPLENMQSRREHIG